MSEVRLSDIPIAIEAPAISREEFWRRKAERPALKPLGKPCHDCAVVCEFYSSFSDELAEQPTDIQRRASLAWFCHNHPNRACRGNIDRLARRAPQHDDAQGGRDG